MARHVDHLEGVIAHVQSHAVLKGNDRSIGRVPFQELGFLRPKGGHAGDMRWDICGEDAGPHAFVRDDGHIKKGVAGPVVTMGFCVNDVAELPAPGDLRF